jgi:hypothetical protein
MITDMTTTIIMTITIRRTAPATTIIIPIARLCSGRRRISPTARRSGFFQAPDPTSFLRLARIPFEIAAGDANLKLLRVEIDALTDVGSLTPHLGGGTFRYDPLPSNFVSRRRRLRFVYFDGASLRALSYAELRGI